MGSPASSGVDLPNVVLRGVMPGAAITGDAQIGSRSTRIGMDLWCGMGSKEPGPAGRELERFREVPGGGLACLSGGLPVAGECGGESELIGVGEARPVQPIGE